MQLWSLITPLDLLLQGGSCCIQFFLNTEEGFHTNICTSANQCYVTDTIAQLIDWTFPLVIENQFEENNWLIAVIDYIAHPYFVSTLETWVPCWRPVSQTFLLHLNYLCSKNHLRKNRYFQVTPVYMKASVLKSAMPMTRSWDGRDVSSCFQLKGRRRLCEYAFLPFWSIWGIHYLESVVLSTAMTLPVFLLQHLFAHSKTSFSDLKIACFCGEIATSANYWQKASTSNSEWDTRREFAEMRTTS